MKGSKEHCPWPFESVTSLTLVALILNWFSYHLNSRNSPIGLQVLRDKVMQLRKKVSYLNGVPCLTLDKWVLCSKNSLLTKLYI